MAPVAQHRVEERLAALGLVLPPLVKPPAGVVLPFRFVRVIGSRATISGHSPQNADGTIAAPLGKVGSDLTVEQGYHAARLTALSILATLTCSLVATTVAFLGLSVNRLSSPK